MAATCRVCSAIMSDMSDASFGGRSPQPSLSLGQYRRYATPRHASAPLSRYGTVPCYRPPRPPRRPSQVSPHKKDGLTGTRTPPTVCVASHTPSHPPAIAFLDFSRFWTGCPVLTFYYLLLLWSRLDIMGSRLRSSTSHYRARKNDTRQNLEIFKLSNPDTDILKNVQN